MQKRSPTFMYWDFILRYETRILIFAWAHTEKNFALAVLEKLTPLFLTMMVSCPYLRHEVLVRSHQR